VLTCVDPALTFVDLALTFRWLSLTLHWLPLTLRWLSLTEGKYCLFVSSNDANLFCYSLLFFGLYFLLFKFILLKMIQKIQLLDLEYNGLIQLEILLMHMVVVSLLITRMRNIIGLVWDFWKRFSKQISKSITKSIKKLLDRYLWQRSNFLKNAINSIRLSGFNILRI